MFIYYNIHSPYNGETHEHIHRTAMILECSLALRGTIYRKPTFLSILRTDSDGPNLPQGDIGMQTIANMFVALNHISQIWDACPYMSVLTHPTYLLKYVHQRHIFLAYTSTI